MSKEIKRATGLLVIEVIDSNPNGDPDRESDPRQRPNGHGEISPVSFKRKIRDLLEDHNSPFFQSLPSEYVENSECYSILELRGRDRNAISGEMADDITTFNSEKFLKSTFVQKYWDARVFGNTFLEVNANKGFIKTGVVQFGMGVSISPVEIRRNTHTNKAGVQEGKNAGMAPLGFRFVQHGVYCMPFFVNPNFAGKTGCTAEDIDLLKLLIPKAYDLNRSTIRSNVPIRHAWYMEHLNSLGSCPDHLLIEALMPERKGDPAIPSTTWKDYEDRTELPEELRKRLGSAIDLMAL
jgi:CRISPR-associated protein Csd2